MCRRTLRNQHMIREGERCKYFVPRIYTHFLMTLTDGLIILIGGKQTRLRRLLDPCLDWEERSLAKSKIKLWVSLHFYGMPHFLPGENMLLADIVIAGSMLWVQEVKRWVKLKTKQWTVLLCLPFSVTLAVSGS